MIVHDFDQSLEALKAIVDFLELGQAEWALVPAEERGEVFVSWTRRRMELPRLCLSHILGSAFPPRHRARVVRSRTRPMRRWLTGRSSECLRVKYKIVDTGHTANTDLLDQIRTLGEKMLAQAATLGEHERLPEYGTDVRTRRPAWILTFIVYPEAAGHE